MRVIQFAPYVMAVVGVAVVAYGLTQRMKAPPIVVSSDTVTFTDKLGTTLIFPRRIIAVAGFETTEVQLPRGTWIDCRLDCAQTIRDQYVDIFEAQQQRR